MTLNWGGPLASPEAVRLALTANDIDIACFQELPPTVLEADLPPGWYLATGPDGTAIASRFPVRKMDQLQHENLGASSGASRYLVATPAGRLPVVSLHLPTPRSGLSAVLSHKFDGLDDLRHSIEVRDRASETVRGWIGAPLGRVIVAGDFNLPPESTIFRRDWSDFGNAFSEAGNGWGRTFSTTWHSVRIDHILHGGGWRATAAWVGPDVSSDHMPLMAELEPVAPVTP